MIMRHHSHFISDMARHTYDTNGRNYNWEVRFLEWFATPWNYETREFKLKEKQRKEKFASRPHLKPMSPLEQKIGLAFLGLMVVGMIVMGIYF